MARAGARPAGLAVRALRLAVMRPAPGRSPRAVARALRARPGVARVEVEHRATPRALPDDPALVRPETAPGTAPGTTLQWWAPRLGLPALWDVTDGRFARVAVIDTGVDATHPDLAPRVSAQVDLDDDPRTAPTGDESGHGTHVASLACATGDNAIGIVGAGDDCRLIAIKSDLSDASVAAAIVRATDLGADAITMAFGATGSAPLPIRRAVVRAARRGVVLVAAAADQPVDQQGYPADLLQPTGTGPALGRGRGLVVTAAQADDTRAGFAGYGSQISLAAYGAYGVAGQGGPPGILGAFPAGPVELERQVDDEPPCRCRTSIDGDTRYAYLQGTSMATPVVAGVAAVLRRLNPDVDLAQLLGVLKATARRPSGAWTPDLGWGILDAGAAVERVRRIDRRAPDAIVRRVARTGVRRVTLRLGGRDVAPAGCVASGLVAYELWRASGRGRPTRLLRTRRSIVRVSVRPGVRSAFYVRAVDRAGNRERLPPRPDAVVAPG